MLRTLILHETTARSIRSAAPLIVPGLLQTEGYARVMMGSADSVDQATVDSRVAVRMERQSLLKRWNPPAFVYFIYEAALRCPVGTNRVMNEQMLHLAFLADRPQVTLRVVPFADGAVAAAIGQFTLMDFADHGPVLYSENIFASLFVENPEDIQFAKGYLAELDAVALSAEESREFLVRCAGDYDRPDEGALNVRRAHPSLAEE
ncbi:DUF5753 domain-containing protein [Amycolatopsis sp. CA-230715]|uniref:DUF5753 domain-containing protein n=1 Tax=Amycolatopsis sp. CA-230715 TaxID=2745196 RepID=UPI002112880B|nr:DUF5753 domain-containing protein [Amycolatopsis sp. CA-230715]